MIEYPYFLSARIISRKSGGNAVAAAAYRSGSKLVEGDGDAQQKPLEHDYRRRSGVMSAFILAPSQAPNWMRDRQNLWQGVEAAEKRVDAQLAREVIVALPAVDIFDHLIPANKNKRLGEFYERMLKRYADENFVKEGMIADIALHEPADKNDDRHYHAHIMLSMREIKGDEFGKKERSWNESAKLERWRSSWSALVNESLKAKNIGGFVDHRSYEERGLDIAATRPLGSKNAKMERFGVVTPAGNDNRKVKEDNKAGHKYLEKVFEHAPSASHDEIITALEKEGFADPDAMIKQLEQEGIILALHSKETGFKSGLYSYAPMQKRANELKGQATQLLKSGGFDLDEDLVSAAIGARGDKLVREALAYTAKPQGFKVIEAANNGHKKTYMKACRDLYQKAGYEVVGVARNNQGKDAFKQAGFTKGVLTYRDLLRRFGERYKGSKSQSKKVIIIDGADQLSPLQDKEIFRTARKIGAKLIYIGSPKAKSKRNWQSMFAYYKKLARFKRLRDKFLRKSENMRYELIRSAFINARSFSALKMQGARYLHGYGSASLAKQATLDLWFKKMKPRDEKRFILTSKDKDAATLNFAIQKERLRRKHLKEKYGKMFRVSYKSDQGSTLERDMFLYWRDMIQFKKSYKDIGIEEGTRARVVIHYGDKTILETDDGRRVRVDLRKHNGFDLGYAGRIASNTDHELDESYIYHTSANALDDAPIMFQKTNKPPHIFYDDNQVSDVQDLSSQLLGKRHNLLEGFAAVAGYSSGNDNYEPDEEELGDEIDDNSNEFNQNSVG